MTWTLLLDNQHTSAIQYPCIWTCYFTLLPIFPYHRRIFVDFTKLEWPLEGDGGCAGVCDRGSHQLRMLLLLLLVMESVAATAFILNKHLFMHILPSCTTTVEHLS